MAQPLLPNLLIEGYRGLRRLELKKLGHVNLIVGQNGVGKTSVLEAVRIYSSHASPDALGEILSSRDELDPLKIEPQEFSSDEVLALFNGRPSSYGSPPSIRIGPISDPRELRTAWVPLKLDNLGQAVYLFDREKASEYTEGSLPVLWMRQAVTDLRVLPFVRGKIYGSANSQNPHPRGPRLPEPSIFVSSRGIAEDHLEQLWNLIALTDFERDLYPALTPVIRDIQQLSFIGSMSGRRRTAKARIKGVDQPVPLRSLGEGIYRFLGIALALVNARNGFLLIDEFENGLHYKTQEALWRFVIRTARELSVQVFATTHSRDCIGAFGRAAADDPRSEGVLTKLERIGDDVVAKQLDEEDIVLASENLAEIR